VPISFELQKNSFCGAKLFVGHKTLEELGKN
jgi:hypothetical protein